MCVFKASAASRRVVIPRRLSKRVWLWIGLTRQLEIGLCVRWCRPDVRLSLQRPRRVCAPFFPPRTNRLPPPACRLAVSTVSCQRQRTPVVRRQSPGRINRGRQDPRPPGGCTWFRLVDIGIRCRRPDPGLGESPYLPLSNLGCAQRRARPAQCLLPAGRADRVRRRRRFRGFRPIDLSTNSITV